MGLAATVYAELLYRQGHGHPLWYPEPSDGLDGCVHEIHLGDVGYLDESGGFRRLFNITVPAEHELNKGGVPDSFTPVTFNPALRRRREKALDPGELCSEGVERVRIDGTFGADLMAHGGLKIGYTFKCSSHRGAFLDLKDHATKEWIELNPEFSDYMRRNHDSWYTFVTDPGKLGLQCSPEDIILVRGTVKTSSWTIGAFPGQTDRSNDIYGGGQVASIGKVKLRVERSHCESQKCVKRSGPGRAPLRPIQSAVSQDLNVKEVDLRDQFQQQDAWLVKDQCIFLSYHKIKYRKLLPKKIVANADPASFDTDNDSNSESSAVLGIDIDIDLDTEHVPPVTPLDDLLDYILEVYKSVHLVISHALILLLVFRCGGCGC
ncbi:hypothetical protein BC629DRAFT_1177844 [Irpex lacteus]|nr:hypothetical protein BC629DRAFT_1177844 [Irpex lacteus]